MIEIKSTYEKLNYSEELPVRGKTISDNRFLKVTLHQNDYFFSSLPGLHNSTLEEFDFKIKYFFKNVQLDFSHINFSKRFFNLVSTSSKLFENIQEESLFVIETLLLSIIKKKHPDFFSSSEIKINELYRPSRDLSYYADSKCLKVKINPQTIKQTLMLISDLNSQNKSVTFRLDGNKKFELDEMIQLTSALNLVDAKIDYIEEPFKNYYDSLLLKKRSSIVIAIDETFASFIQCTQENFPTNTPVVVKPSLFGISTIYNWMDNHAKNRIIVSSTFEHPSVKIGLDFLARKRPSEFHGLENFF